MSTKDSPQQEDKHIVASSDIENGLQDHDFSSEANEAIFGAPEDVIDSINDNNMENGWVFRGDNPPDGLGDNENLVEEKDKGNKASLVGIGGATQIDKEIDRAELEALTNIIRNKKQDYTEEEKQAIRKGMEFYEKCKEGRNFDELKSPDERVKMKLVHVDGASSGTGFATTVLDASVEECAANEFYLDSREFKKGAKERGITDYHVKNVNDHTLYYITTRNLGLPGFVPRDGRSKITWFKQEDGKVIIDVTDTDELQVDFPVKAGNILVKIHTVWVFEPLDPIGVVPQTSVTFTTKVDLGGVFFSSITNKIAPQFLGVLSDLRKKFDKSRDIDGFKLLQTVDIINNEIQDYTAEEEEVLKDGKKFYMDCKTSNKFKIVKSPDPKVKMKFVHLEGESQGIGICEAVVDASLAECVAYEFIKDSRERQAKLGKKYKAIETKKLNDHSQLYLNRRSFRVRGLSDREWRSFICWQKEEGDKICWTVYKDTNLLDEDFPLSSQTVLATVRTTWMFEALSTTGGVPQTRVTFASTVDIKGSVPDFIMNHLSTGYASNMIELRKKFHKSDDKIDRAALEYLANIIKNESQDYTEEEEKAIKKGKEFYEKCIKSKQFEDLKSPDPRVKMKSVYIEGQSLVSGVESIGQAASIKKRKEEKKDAGLYTKTLQN
ncbi:hypothetical protein TrCOL_g6405 [Triparma columacea]|uniref:Uncharacterized protein n=1 Tax=Triparma columacea TaxID=722753 RepID=A0A9W7GGY6_9STRA|nr:hypothetical protein TrCOL_g6405 [Triparma columacea]